MEKFLEMLLKTTWIIMIIMFAGLIIKAIIIEKTGYAEKVEYQEKIIKRITGTIFESYEDYLAWRIEKGE